ncbi:hypothetical protein Tco_0466991, partial [Tanacetum coccineum]
RRLVESYNLMQKKLLALIKPKWNATIAIKQGILLESVESRELKNSGNKDGSRIVQKEDSKALVTVDGEGVDWTNHSEDEDYALMACNSSDSDTEVISCSNKYKESYLKKLYDA